MFPNISIKCITINILHAGRVERTMLHRNLLCGPGGCLLRRKFQTFSLITHAVFTDACMVLFSRPIAPTNAWTVWYILIAFELRTADVIYYSLNADHRRGHKGSSNHQSTCPPT